MGVTSKDLQNPDQTMTFDHGKVQSVKVGAFTINLNTFEPGWRWSESVGPIAGTTSCQARHNGYIESGRMHVRMDDGEEVDLEPGEFFVLQPGHDAWTLGDEPCIAFDFSPQIASYAKPG